MNYDAILDQMKREHEQQMNAINAARAQEARQMEDYRRQAEEQQKAVERAQREEAQRLEQARREYEKQAQEHQKAVEKAQREEAQRLEQARKDYEKQMQDQQKAVEKARRDEAEKLEQAKKEYEKEQAKNQEIINKSRQYQMEEQAAIRGEIPASANYNSVSSGPANRVSNGSNIYFSADKLISNKNGLNGVARDMRNAWNSIKNTELVNMKNSWAGSDAQAYIDKINALDAKVNAAIDAINLLSRTFDSAAKKLEETQRNATSTLNNI